MRSQQALQQSLASMQSRLDGLVAAMNTAAGAQRAEAMSAVIQEMASQLAAMRQMLLGAGLVAADAQIGQDAVFITPGGAAPADGRRSGELGEPTAAEAQPETNRSRLEPAAEPSSSLATQAESRRRGEP